MPYSIAAMGITVPLLVSLSLIKEKQKISYFVASNSTLDWGWIEPVDHACHVMDNPVYTSCKMTGNFWFDLLKFDETGFGTTGAFHHNSGRRFSDLDRGNFQESEIDSCVELTKREYCNLTIVKCQ